MRRCEVECSPARGAIGGVSFRSLSRRAPCPVSLCIRPRAPWLVLPRRCCAGPAPALARTRTTAGPVQRRIMSTTVYLPHRSPDAAPSRRMARAGGARARAARTRAAAGCRSSGTGASTRKAARGAPRLACPPREPRRRHRAARGSGARWPRRAEGWRRRRRRAPPPPARCVRSCLACAVGHDSSPARTPSRPSGLAVPPKVNSTLESQIPLPLTLR